MSWTWVIAALLVVAAILLLRWRISRARLAFVESYRFHPAIVKRVGEKYPALSQQQLDLIFEGLRDYFFICNLAKRRMVAMPSQAVDEAWHIFILFTREYQRFCRHALGRFLHHTPVEAMRTPTHAQEGIKRAWRLACHREGISPRVPERLPRLFAIDGQLGIPDGFLYSLDCRDRNSPNRDGGYCAGHIGCTSGCTGESGSDSSGGFSGGLGDSGDSGCGGGCGGD